MRCGSHEPAQSVIDLARYPLHRLDDPAYQTLIEQCREKMSSGFAVLRDFVHAEAAERMAAEAIELEARGHGFYSTERHGSFLSESHGAPSTLPQRHPRRVIQSSSKRLFAADELSGASPLCTLYEWPPLLAFLRAVLSQELHLSADPMGAFYKNVYSVGDSRGWHFDNSKFSVSLILQPADSGGDFEFAPGSRGAVETLAELPEDDQACAPIRPSHLTRVLPHPSMSSHLVVCSPIRMQVGEARGAVKPQLRAGDLYLFEGRNALHRVTPVRSGRRVNAILTFNSTPGEVLNEYTRLKFFGRDLARQSQ